MILMLIMVCLWIKNSTAIPKYLELNKIDVEDSESSLEITAIQNSTTCKQFIVNSTFIVNHVLGIDWKIWYYWNHQYQDDYLIRFSQPTEKIVNSYRLRLKDEIFPPVTWQNAILYMQSSIDFSALFFKTKEDGLFRIIPSPFLSESSNIELVFALKVIEPRVMMAIMNCNYRLCYALAPADKFPDYLKCDEEAKKIGFHGYYGQCNIEPSLTLEYSLTKDLSNRDAHNKEILLDILNQFGSNKGCNCT